MPDDDPVEALRQAARAARAAGRFADAAAGWRSVLQRMPEDWRSALELRADLRSHGLYSEADPAFRLAARSLPDEEWLAHYSALYTFYPGDLTWLARRARSLLGSQPEDRRAHRLLGEVLLQQRRWHAAERHLAQGPASGEPAVKQALAGLYRRLGRLERSGAADYAIAMINLASNPGRLRTMTRLLRDVPVPWFRVAGVEGRLLPKAAMRRLVGQADPTMRGTLGCFLSHVSAWDTMVARGLPHCLIIEDDVEPLLPLPAGLGALGLPPDFDVCFVNDRLQPRWPAVRIAAQDGYRAVRFAEAFATFLPEDNAPGTDGYIVSDTGARKLLAWVEEDGFAHDVDWRLLAYCLTPAECSALPPGHARGVLDGLRHIVGRPDRLNAYVLHPALIRTVPLTSDREDGNRSSHGRDA